MLTESRLLIPRLASKRRLRWAASLLVLFLAAGLLADQSSPGQSRRAGDDDATEARIAEGREIFRFDTFGDEQQWTDRLRMHEVIEAAIDPLTALQLGLKVDVDALPDQLLFAIAAGDVDLTDPATTLELIRLGAVIGVVGTVEAVDGKARL